jgi:hypothetical protein
MPEIFIFFHLAGNLSLEIASKKVYTGKDVNTVYTKKINLGR